MWIRFIRAGIVSIVATVVLAVITLAIIETSAFGDSADLSYRTLDYDVTATANGDLKVTQHIDVKMRERTDSDDNTKPWKQLFQQYTLNSGTLTDISDISVRNVTDGIDYAQQSEPKLPSDVFSDKEWNSDYANHWYIADVSDGSDHPKAYTPGTDGLKPSASATEDNTTVEIGWNIPVTTEADSMKFDVSFTMHDVATKWKDVASFQWEPFGKKNQVPISTVTGTVHFPNGITGKPHGHGCTPSALRKPSATATAATRSRPTTSTMATTSMWSRRSMPPKPRASPAREPAIISRT